MSLERWNVFKTSISLTLDHMDSMIINMKDGKFLVKKKSYFR